MFEKIISRKKEKLMFYANTKETAYSLPVNGSVTCQISDPYDEIWFYLEVPSALSGMYHFYTERSGSTVPIVGTLANSSGFVTDVSTVFNGQFAMYPVIDANEMYYLLLMSQGDETGRFTLTTNAVDLNNPPPEVPEDEPCETPLANDNANNMVADPVDASRGAFTSKIDLISFADEQKLTLSVHYDSQIRTSGAVGLGWYHNYEKKLVESGSKLLLFESPQHYQVYQYNGNSHLYECTSPGKQGYTIKLESAGYHLDCNKDHEEWYDAETGDLIKWMSHQGDEINLTYVNNTVEIKEKRTRNTIKLTFQGMKLTKVTGPNECEATLFYANDLLTAIKDVNGNTLNFSYDEDYRLLTATDGMGCVYVTNTYSDGKIISQKDAKNNSTHFAYGENTVTITNRNGDISRRVYNDDGLLISYTDENGYTTAYTYDARGNMLTETDALGNTTTKEYNDFNKPTKIIDKNGNATTFSYDENGNVTSIVYPNGGKEEYTYDDTNRLKTHKDLNGLITEYTYNTSGYMSFLKQGDREPYEYQIGNSMVDFCDSKGIWYFKDLDAYGRLACKYNPYGEEDEDLFETNYEYDPSGNCVKIIDQLENVVTFEYDANHQKIAETDAEGNRTTYEYDGNMNLVKTVFPDDTCILNEYDNEGRLIRVTDQAGKVTTTVYDAGGRILSKQFPDGGTISYTYDAVGNVLAETNLLGGVTSRTYDAMGNVLTETTPDGRETTFTYDNMNRLTFKTSLQSGSNYYSYSASGLLTYEEDDPGRAVYYAYDVYGNKISEQIGNDEAHVSTFTYDANNNLISSTDRLGNTTAYEYDSGNRCIKVTNARNHSTLFGYDPCGRRTTVTDARGNTVTTAYDKVGNILSVTDAKGNVILSKTYNNRNLPATVTDANGTRTYTYNALGKPLTITDAIGTKQFAYDAMGRNIQVTDEAGGISTSTFNAMGQPLTVTGPGGAVTTYTYDNMGNKTSQTTPSGGTVTYSEFLLGKPKRVVDARGNAHQYEYNTRGQVVSHSAPGLNETYTYDLEGNLLTSSDGSHTVSRTYDKMNRMTAYAEGNEGLIHYSYDSVGNIFDMNDPYTATFNFDANNNLISTKDHMHNVSVSYTYDENNKLRTETKPDGSITTYSYDAFQRLTSKVARTAANEMIICYEYTYDARGRLATEKDLVNNRIMCYTYDNRDWVINRRTIDLETEEYVDDPFTYDPAGNLQNLIGDDAPFYENNQLIVYKNAALDYDAEGNLLYGAISDPPLSYTYDVKNRLLNDTQDFYCAYNADNIRYKIDGFSTDWSLCFSNCYDLYNTNGRLSQLLMRSSFDYTAYYFYGLGLVGEYTNGSFKTYHYDYRGSTVAITDASGNITDTFAYDTYGKQTARTGNTDTPFRYNGRDGVMTECNGLLYMRARYYSPDMRRFISADVLPGGIDNAVTLNRYAYANANPVTNIDPFGLCAERGDLSSALTNDELKKLQEICEALGIVYNSSTISVNALYPLLISGIKKATRPNNIGVGTWNKQISADLKWVDDILGPSSKLAKSLEFISNPWFDAATIGIDVVIGVNENFQKGESGKEIVSDAVIDVGFGAVGIGLSALSVITAKALVGATIGSAAPGIGTAVGAIAGAVAGTAFFLFTEVYKRNGKTVKERIDDHF